MMTGLWATDRARHPDAYVFCVLAAVDPKTADPLDIAQWDSDVAQMSRMNTALTMTLSSTKATVSPKKVTSTGLKDAVRRAGQRGKDDGRSYIGGDVTPWPGGRPA